MCIGRFPLGRLGKLDWDVATNLAPAAARLDLVD
jgi:hypothetical protein